MADEIAVNIVAADSQFTSSAQKAAAAVAAITAQEQRLGNAAESAGVDKRKFSQQFAKVERDRLNGEKNAERAKATQQKRDATVATQQAKRDARAIAIAEKKAAADEKKATDERTSKNRQLARVLLGRKAVILGEATGIGTAVVAGIELGGALVAASLAATALFVAIGAVAEKAATARDNARGFLGVLTKGRGAEALADVDHLAGQLGVKMQDVRDTFIQFRQAGLDNTQSARLEKLVADLNTVDRSGELAKQAISRVLSYTSPNGRQTIEQVNASKRAMALLAKQAGVSGKGFESAAASVGSIQGAFNRLDNSKTQALEDIGDRIRPGLTRATQAAAKLVEKFLASQGGKKVIDGLVAGIDGLASGAERAADSISNALDDPDTRAGLELTATLIKETGEGIGFAAAEVTALGAAIFGEVGKLANLEGDALLWGSNMVDGIIQGISNAATKLYRSVVDMADRIKSSFAEALDMHSPSRWFFKAGLFSGEGYDRGAEKGFPSGADMAQRMLPEPAQIYATARATAAEPAQANPFGFGQQTPIFGASSPQQAQPSVVQVTIQNIDLHVPQGEDPNRWMRAAGREIGLGIQAIMMTQGAPSDG